MRDILNQSFRQRACGDDVVTTKGSHYGTLRFTEEALFEGIILEFIIVKK